MYGYEEKGFDFMKKLTVIGGDERFAFLIDAAQKKGYNVCSYAIDAGNLRAYSLSEAFNFSRNVILPLPVFSEKNIINTPNYKGSVTAQQILNEVCNETHIIGGRFTDEFKAELIKKGATVTDIMEREEFAILNAIPTAEGAVSLAIDNTDFTLHGAKILILGFGRIGKSLSEILKGFGARVYAVMRNTRDLAYAELMGVTPVKMTSEDFEQNLKDADIVFNTAPALILDSKRLNLMKNNSLIIDLASLPGGVDKIAVQNCQIRHIHALSLPVKYSPITAAKILADTVFNAIDV